MKLRTFARGTKELRCDEEPWLLNGRRARPADDGCDQTNAGRHAPMDMPSAIVRYAEVEMLDNYANTLTLTGRHSEALKASEQALEHYRAARDSNPSLDNDVARVLSNYCQRLAATGRFIEAAAAGADAITLFEQLSTNPRNEVHAATTRAVVAIYTVAAGNTNAGMLLAAQAALQGEQLLAKGVMSREQLATIYIEATKATQPNPSLAVRYAKRAVQLLREAGLSGTPDYATALRNLAALHGMAGQIDPGLMLSPRR